ncbi:Uncharacterized 52.8 kDa protein in TAR-I ttuC' 3'region [Hyphomicrobiales bacterium]|nr:Uncharacterized 52.8 kDa protein in TAR-I ttuC' 3'region [Hyphomicrobiales bacterium]CAH1692089.1 Uncharacterized 52.8 kDa protein in TAR-I ttuC' 3'region [Hyphomicrobiales bacterium]
MMNDVLANLSLGLSVAVSPVNLAFCFVGTLAGTLVGILPGVGPLATISMLLPLTFVLDPTTALIMLAGIYYGAQYGGSTTAILLNVPGEASSVVTCIEGNKLAQQGRAGAALAIAALGSFFAGTIAAAVIFLLSPPLAKLALAFRPADYTSLMAFGLLCSVVLASGSMIKSIGMVLVGLLFGLVGTDVNSGVMRYTLDIDHLAGGIGVVAIAMALFGISDIIANLERPGQMAIGTTAKVGRLWPSRKDFREAAFPVLRGTGIGSILGVLPGGGAMLSSFASYMVEKRLAGPNSRFGNGAIQGLAGPESANNAGAQTSLIPLLTLGVPGNALIALMAGAMMIHGIMPGPQIMTREPGLFWGLIASMWIGNLMLVIINLPLIGIWVSLLRVPYRLLFPAIVVLCAVGAYGVNNSPFEVLLMAIFAGVGFLFRKLGCEAAPLILGFILGPMMEENLRRTLILSRGDWLVFLREPISATFLAASVVLALMFVLPTLRRGRQDAFQEE